MDKLQLRETILKQIERPHIPEREFPACMFGVAADSREVQTRALQLAIDTISREGGGRLMLPGGTIRTGALELKSRVELHLQHRGSVLSFVNEERALHYPMMGCHRIVWEMSRILTLCSASRAQTAAMRMHGQMISRTFSWKTAGPCAV